MRLSASTLALGFVFVIACSPGVDDLSSGPNAPAACGNGVLDVGEVCDDARVVTQTCADLVGSTSTGNVRCTACGFDLRGCLGAANAAGKAGAASANGGSGGLASGGSSGGMGGTGIQGGAAGSAGPSGGAGGTSGASAGGGGSEPGGSGGASIGGVGGATSGGAGGASVGVASGSSVGGASGSSVGGASGASAAGAGGSSVGNAGSGGAPPSCATSCGPFEQCLADGSCGCGAQSIELGGGCWPLSPSPPAGRSVAEVCAARAMSVKELYKSEIAKTPGECGPHLPSVNRLGDVANRLAYYRWLVGLPPVPPALVDNGASRDHAECAAAVAYDASPVLGSKCATDGALSALSRSFRYRSSFFVDVIDEYVRDAFPGGPQDAFRLGLLRQYVKPFSWGEHALGTQGGTCLEVPAQTTATTLGKSIWPPPGRVPIELVGQRWTIAPLIENAIPSVKVTEAASGKSREVKASLQTDTHQNGPYAVLTRTAWTPLVDVTYSVALSQGGDVVVSYDFTPIECP